MPVGLAIVLLSTNVGADVPFDCNTCPAVPTAVKAVAPDPD